MMRASSAPHWNMGGKNNPRGGLTPFRSFDDSSHLLLEKSKNLQHQNEQYQGEISTVENYSAITYNYGHRSYHDICFLAIFMIFVLATYAGGVFSIAHHNNNYKHVGSFVYHHDSSRCVREVADQSLASPKDASLLITRDKFKDEERKLPTLISNKLQLQFQHLGHLSKELVWMLAVTLIFSTPCLFGLLWLLNTFTKHIVYACLPFFILIPIFMNTLWFVACAVNQHCKESFSLALRISAFLFIFALCGIILLVIYSNRDSIELTIRILHTASEALRRNMGLLLVLPGLTLLLFLYLGSIIVFLYFARMNGKVMPNSKIEEYEYLCGRVSGIECCLWKEDPWVPAYYGIAIFTIIWSATTMFEAQVYVISGTVAQWYFQISGTSSTATIRHSVRNAFGPSFGTVCFSGLIFAVVQMIRAVVEKARTSGKATSRSSGHGVFNFILGFCLNCILSAMEFVNKFTINFAAITGENYCSSARMAYELLRRNLLSAVVVETVSTRLLFGIFFVVSLVYAMMVWIILKAATSLGRDAYYVTAFAWLVLFVILGFFVRILDNVIDTVYICYAIDKDTGSISKSEVHHVYGLLPLSRNETSSLPTV